MKKILCILLFALVFSFSVSAEENVYREQYDAAEVYELEEECLYAACVAVAIAVVCCIVTANRAD